VVEIPFLVVTLSQETLAELAFAYMNRLCNVMSNYKNVFGETHLSSDNYGGGNQQNTALRKTDARCKRLVLCPLAIVLCEHSNVFYQEKQPLFIGSFRLE
jgi:hypothetical protein